MDINLINKALKYLLNVEVGSNSNGEYIRFPFGLQICWGVIETVITNGYVSINYPASFTDNPTATFSVCYASNESSVRRVAYTTSLSVYNDSLSAYVRDANSPSERPAGNIRVNYIVIGKWK